MKKILLSMVALAASTMVANAGKVAFVAADNVYPADSADQVVVLPSGFDADVLPLTSDAVMFSKFAKSSYVTSATFRVNGEANPTITPANGVKVTGIKIIAQTTSNFGVFTGFTLSEDKLSQSVSGLSYTEATALENEAQARITVIEVEYEGTPAVKMPTISADYDYILPADKKVTLTAEAGAKIYYTLDGTEPTEASTLYTEPFTLEKTAYVRAIAVTDDGTSFVASKGYVSVPAGVQIATYNFTDMSSLNLTKSGSAVDIANTWEADGSSSKNKRITLSTSYTLAADKTSITGFSKNSSSKYSVRLYMSNTFGNLTQFRLYNCNLTKYNVTDDDYYLAGVVFVGGVNTGLGIQDTSNTETGITNSNDDGSYEYESIYSGSTSATSVWLSKEGVKNSSLTLMMDKTKNADSDTQFFQQVYILYAEKDNGGNTNAIENVAVDANAPVEFYNLQGVRVANPTNGIYVKRQGNTATKVLVK